MSQIIPFEFIGWAMRLLLAQGVILLFLLLNVVNFSMPHGGDFKPFFLLMAVYYWAIYRPTVMPVAYTFALGLAMDFVSGLPLGITPLSLVAMQAIVRRSRLFLMGQPYVTVWIGFAIVALANATFIWIVMSLFRAVMPFMPMLVGTFLSVLIFPMASTILLWVHRVLPVASQPLRSVG